MTAVVPAPASDGCDTAGVDGCGEGRHGVPAMPLLMLQDLRTPPSRRDIYVGGGKTRGGREKTDVEPAAVRGPGGASNAKKSACSFFIGRGV